jgi:hypothetical protein
VLPVLQRADGSYIGTIGTGPQPGQVAQTNMIAFTSSGSTLWTGPNDTPQIATSDGGVIGVSGTTYDQYGNVDGQVHNLPIQSWLGNAYQVGSVDQVASSVIDIASSFWAFAGANASSNSAGVNFFPPLANCSNSPATCPLGPGDAIWNAYQDLMAELSNDTTPCSVGANLWVFSKFKDSNGYPMTRKAFVGYLTSKTPDFDDGTASTWDYKNAVCGTGGSGFWNWVTHLNCSSSISGSMKSFFANNLDATAATETPSYPFRTFLRPSSIETNNYGKTIDNEALLFHEALHGMTGLYDYNPFGASVETNLGLGPPSQNISNYIAAHVLSICPVNSGGN